jgi:hypothetical protein
MQGNSSRQLNKANSHRITLRSLPDPGGDANWGCFDELDCELIAHGSAGGYWGQYCLLCFLPNNAALFLFEVITVDDPLLRLWRAVTSSCGEVPRGLGGRDQGRLA